MGNLEWQGFSTHANIFENTPMDTPMTSLCTIIEINLKQMIGDKNVPAEENPNNYYVM
ncbi:MAG: hypothetical protein K2X37_13745 [Chitinophagaceae bacterium]|nr:hypothetical protein [Chitinophagaceae bacterium]